MAANEFLPSDLSECNSVLDLPATFSLPVGDGYTSEPTISTLFSAKHTINTAGSDHPDCEEGIASVEAVELHPNSEVKQQCTGVTQTMEDFFQETEQRKPLESNTLSEKIVHLLSSKIAQLKEKKGSQYLLRSFQMALVLFHTHGPDIFKQRNSNNMHFCSSVNLASDSKELHPLPGLSPDVINFIQQEISK